MGILSRFFGSRNSGDTNLECLLREKLKSAPSTLSREYWGISLMIGCLDSKGITGLFTAPKPNLSCMQVVVNDLADTLGEDDNASTHWTPKDGIDYENGSLNRVWRFDKYGSRFTDIGIGESPALLIAAFLDDDSQLDIALRIVVMPWNSAKRIVAERRS